MGCYLPKPKTETDLEDLEGCGLRVSAGAMQGWRITQEDAHNAIVSPLLISFVKGVLVRVDERYFIVCGVRWPRWP